MKDMFSPVKFFEPNIFYKSVSLSDLATAAP